MPDPIVTALINTYNYGRFIEEAVESVLAQDYPAERLDVIVVDDGSSDDTPKRMERFAGRIRYFRLEHKGQAAALNVGIAESRGEILAFLDADDSWKPSKIRRVVAAFDAHPDAGIVYHAFELWRQDGSPVPQQEFRAFAGYVPDHKAELLAYEGQATSGLAIRRSLLERMLPLPEEFRIGCSDGYISYNAMFRGPVVGLKEPLTRYRLHGANFFSYERPDPVKMRVKLETWRALMREHLAWLERNGLSCEDPRVAIFHEKMRLNELWMQAGLQTLDRWSFFELLRRERRLYRDVWSPRYRVFKAISSWAALVVGFEHTLALRRSYHSGSPFLQYRKKMAPRFREIEAAPLSTSR